jgi:hypothetical protein
LSRVYVATGVSRKGVRSGVSNRVAVPISDLAVSPPPSVSIQFSETAITVTWTLPPDAALPVQRAPLPTEIAARPLVGGRVTTTYNVYEVTRTDAGPTESDTPINTAPTPATGAATAVGRFGAERCFVVHAGLQFGNARIEGPASVPACVETTDKFAPAAPKGLVAVGSEGGVSLIWDANGEADLAGYLVLRGEVGPAGTAVTLAPLGQEPIRETTFRDTTVRPGVRYVYAVVAVDTASPRNVSAESNRVEEGAR